MATTALTVTPVKTQRIGIQNLALHPRANQQVLARTLLYGGHQMARKRYSPEEIHARLVLGVGLALCFTFVMIVCAVLWALVFVTQPMTQSPNDKAFLDGVLIPITLFLSGALSGVLASNGLKSKPQPQRRDMIPDDELFR